MITPQEWAEFYADVLALRTLQQLSVLTCDPVIRREEAAFATVVDDRMIEMAPSVPPVPFKTVTIVTGNQIRTITEARWQQLSARLRDRAAQIAEREGGVL